MVLRSIKAYKAQQASDVPFKDTTPTSPAQSTLPPFESMQKNKASVVFGQWLRPTNPPLTLSEGSAV